MAKFSRKITQGALVLLAASCSGNAETGPPPSAKAPPGSVAFMGDSITAGWPLIDYTSIPTLNFGVSGDNTSQMLARFHNQVIDSDPAIVVILGGVNDFQERGQTGTNTDAIIEMASEASLAGIKVILSSVLPTNYPNPNLNLPEIEAFNASLLNVAKENGYLYVDYYDVMLNANGTVDDSLFNDGLHPNSAGYTKMWAALSPLIEEDLQADVESIRHMDR